MKKVYIKKTRERTSMAMKQSHWMTTLDECFVVRSYTLNKDGLTVEPEIRQL